MPVRTAARTKLSRKPVETGQSAATATGGTPASRPNRSIVVLAGFCGQLANAHWGSRGPGFKSRQPDYFVQHRWSPTGSPSPEILLLLTSEPMAPLRSARGNVIDDDERSPCLLARPRGDRRCTLRPAPRPTDPVHRVNRLTVQLRAARSSFWSPTPCIESSFAPTKGIVEHLSAPPTRETSRP